MIEKNIRELEVKWLNENDWIKMRDFLIIKFQEADTEEKFNFMLQALIGSLFRSSEELDEARKALRLEHITRKEKKRIDELVKEKKIK
jgi:hypothetical protein